MLQLMVLYPQPANAQQFEADYTSHLLLLREKAGIPATAKPYTVTKFLPAPGGGVPPFFQLFTMLFESPEALQATISSAGMQEVAADANRISTGGAPIILIADAG
jgi:uncharacterized protein (TIGR02118 family)